MFGTLIPTKYLRICMKFLPEACLRSRDRYYNFGDDPYFDPDSESGLLSRLLGEGFHFC